MKFFHHAHLRCPRYGKQAYVHTLCDIDGTPPRDYLQKQFSVAYDLFLRVKKEVRLRVMAELCRHGRNWRLRNACACCLYKVKGEEKLDPPFLITMDGNNSLKRFERRERLVRADGSSVPGALVESVDNRPPAMRLLP
jgi:hypothetical protein